MKLEYQIESLIEQNASDFEISKLIKAHIKEYLSSLESIFENSQGKDFLVKHTKAIDEFIKILFKYTLRQYFGNYMPLQNSLPLTLVAMGSYGREELCVYSDVDLMFVYKDVKGYNIEPIISSILYLAWDAGIKLGHRTHKVDELFCACGGDVTIKTAMLESRFLCGSKFLWMESEREFIKIRKHDIKNYIDEKIAERQVQAHKYPLSMEPNIKDGDGALRDANSLFWIASALYGVSKIKDLVPKYISEEEFREYRLAQEWLFRVRSALHLSANKKQDKLVMDFLPNVAKLLRIEKKAHVELVKKTLESLWVLKMASSVFVKRVSTPVFYDKSNFSKCRTCRVSYGLYVENQTLFCSTHKALQSLDKVMSELSRLDFTQLKFDQSYVYYIHKCANLAHNQNKIYSLFKRFLQSQNAYTMVELFYNARVLQHFIKPMKPTINLAQFDGYHNLPVDAHSLKTLYQIDNIKEPFIKALYDDLCGEGRALMRLVAFFHDIGKGRKADHSEVGAKIFKSYASKMGFKDESIAMGTLLIKNHIYMSNIAYKEDIYSEKVIYGFVSTLGTPKALKLLYILTYCDINAVSSTAYNAFISRLLKELYELGINAYEQDGLVDEAARRKKRENAIVKNSDFLALSKMEQKKILSIPANLFFIKNTSATIINTSKWALKTLDYEFNISNEQFLSITLIRTRRFHLSYFLHKLVFLDLAHMEIFELFDGKKYFKIEFNKKANDIEFIKKVIDESFDFSNKPNIKKPTILKNEITLELNHSKTYAKLSLNAKDQQGLIAYLIDVLDKFDLDISSGKIQTVKNRTRNLFLIENNDRLCKNSDQILKLLLDKGL